MHEIKINDRITAVLEYDELCQGPEEFGMLGKIYYFNKSRYRLGTAPVNSDELGEISLKIRQGELFGLPVYAYVHSGVALATTPFSCGFDSGLSGFIACSHEDVANWYGAEMPKEEILEVLRNEVEEFSKFLAGDVYVIKILVDGEEKDIVGGHYGFDCAVACAKELAEEYVKLHEKVVKVVLKTGGSKSKVVLDADLLSTLEKYTKLAQESRCTVLLPEGKLELNVATLRVSSDRWEVNAEGIQFVTSLLDRSNSIETKKFRKMLHGGDVEGFEKLEDGTYVELD